MKRALLHYLSDKFLREPTRFWEVAPENWRMVIDTNVNGPFLMARLATPAMVKAGWGRIINVSMNHETMRRRGLLTQQEGIVWILTLPIKAKGQVPPELGALLERLLFKALLAEDGQGDGHTPSALREARWEFISSAIESGRSVAEAALFLGIKATQAAQILKDR